MAFDSSLYEAQRRALSGQYAQQAALNAYQRYLAESRGKRPILQLQESAFGTTSTGGLGQVPKLTSNYAKRGLTGQGVRSGVYNQALSSYAKDRARTLGYATDDLQGAMRGYDIAGSGYQADYERGLADLESSKARQIAADAQALLQYR